MTKTIIFDFDGTIANTLDSLIEIMNRLSKEFGFRKIKQEEVEYLREKTARQILKNLGISLIKLPFVVRKARKEINSQIEFLNPSVELLSAIQYLKDKNYKIGIVTTNTEDNVRKFLQANNLDKFDFFYTAKRVFGKDRTISKIINDMKLDKSTVYFIGDEIRDIKAGKKVGIKTIAVGWGFNTKEALSRESPDYLIESPKEIEKIFE